MCWQELEHDYEGKLLGTPGVPQMRSPPSHMNGGSYHGEIIVYSRSTINACSLLSHKWWTPLIKFMVGPTIYVRGGSTHLWYSGST